MGKHLDFEEFKKLASKKHNGKYKYLYEEKVGKRYYVRYSCPLHGEFSQREDMHLEGQGCPICRGTCKHTTKQWIQSAKKIHGDKYDYSKSIYNGAFEEVTITCPIHGDFNQTATSHLRGHGCPVCGKLERDKNRRMAPEEYIKRANEVHNGYYSYDNTVYKTINDTIFVTCPKHGDFPVMASTHLYLKSGCPICHRSHAEVNIGRLLSKKGIKYIPSARFDWLKNKIKMSLDVFLPEYNIAIECQGEQHFMSVNYFGGEEVHNGVVQRDSLKYNLCKEHGIEIIYFTTVKDAPEDYIGKLFKNENDLLAYIEEHGKEHSDTDSCKDDIDEMPKQE